MCEPRARPRYVSRHDASVGGPDNPSSDPGKGHDGETRMPESTRLLLGAVLVHDPGGHGCGSRRTGEGGGTQRGAVAVEVRIAGGFDALSNDFQTREVGRAACRER